ncbi:hypothetical protein D1007_28668 [Hordeum vulgare]|nr:hypothetical protein D1007_28668 [Hordeum vulgare]
MAKGALYRSRQQLCAAAELRLNSEHRDSGLAGKEQALDWEVVILSSEFLKLQEKRRQKAEAYIPPDAPRESTAAPSSARASFSLPRPARVEGTSSANGTSTSTSTTVAATKMRSVRGGRVGGGGSIGARKKAEKYARLMSYFTASGNV